MVVAEGAMISIAMTFRASLLQEMMYIMELSLHVGPPYGQRRGAEISVFGVAHPKIAASGGRG